MHDCIEAVQANPAGGLHTFHVKRRLTEFVFEAFVDIASDGLHLRRGVSLTDDEVIRGGIVQFSEVEFNNVFSFDVLNAVDDHIVQLFNGGEISIQNCLCAQIRFVYF